MYSLGLMNFIDRKELNLNKSIDAFLKYKGISSFNSHHSTMADMYIQAHWDQWASFVERSLRKGSLEGKRVKLNNSRELHKKDVEEYQAMKRKEFATIEPEVLDFMRSVTQILKSKGDTFKRSGRVLSFVDKHNIKLPSVNNEGVHPFKKKEPWFKFLLPYKKELLEYIFNK